LKQQEREWKKKEKKIKVVEKIEFSESERAFKVSFVRKRAKIDKTGENRHTYYSYTHIHAC
jgi:hypothetical protein